MLNLYRGSLFEVESECLVNTINTFGVMGAGLARQFKNRYPDMFEAYFQACGKNEINPGACWSYEREDLFIANLAIKRHWAEHGTLEWLLSCLNNLKIFLRKNNIKSCNMPLIGGGCGSYGNLGLPKGYSPLPNSKAILDISIEKLEKISKEIDINIFLF